MIEATSFSVEAAYDLSQDFITGILYDGTDAKIHYSNPINIGIFSGNINKFELFSSGFTQSNSGVLNAKNIRFEDQSLLVTDAKAHITNQLGELKINTNLNQINYFDGIIDTGALSIGNLSLDTVHSLVGDTNFFKNINVGLRTIKVKELTLPNLNLDLQNAHFDFLHDENNLEILGIGNIGSFDLILNDQYHGGIKNAKYQFRADLLDSAVGTTVKSSGKLEISSGPDVHLSFDVRSEVDVTTSILNCLKIFCAPITLDAAYQLDVNGEIISGKVDCGSLACGNSLLRHKISTDNSNKLFIELAKTKIINPIPLAILYNQILSGKKIGNGHEIIFSF